MFVFNNKIPPPNLNKAITYKKHKETKLYKQSFTSWLLPDGQGKTTAPEKGRFEF